MFIPQATSFPSGEICAQPVGYPIKRIGSPPFGEKRHNVYDYPQARGKDVLWQPTLESFSQTDESVTAQIKAFNGETKIVEAKYLMRTVGNDTLTL